MNIVIDQGNTNLKLYYFEQNKIIKKIVYPINNFKFFFNDNFDFVIYSSVSGYFDSITNFFKNKILQFNLSSKIPIKNCYSSQTLGLDRIAAAVGAYYLFPNTNVLIIDIGTAITFDILDKKNQFIGGNISAGIDIRYKALNSNTKNLPLIEDKNFNESIFANNTFDAIKNGILYGILFEIQSYITYSQTIYDNLQIILTGGDAKFFENKLNFSMFVEPDLVAIGLNNILNYNTLNKFILNE